MIPKGSIVLVAASVFGSRAEKPLWREVGANVHGRPRLRNLELYYTARYTDTPGSPIRNLWRYTYPQPWRGIVVGWSTRQTGKVYPASGYDYDYEPGCLEVDKTFTVMMVQPLDTNRWVRPIACLESDLK